MEYLAGPVNLVNMSLDLLIDLGDLQLWAITACELPIYAFFRDDNTGQWSRLVWLAIIPWLSFHMKSSRPTWKCSGNEMAVRGREGATTRALQLCSLIFVSLLLGLIERNETGLLLCGKPSWPWHGEAGGICPAVLAVTCSNFGMGQTHYRAPRRIQHRLDRTGLDLNGIRLEPWESTLRP